LSENYFFLFGETTQFSINQAELASKYQQLQKAVHPDRFADQGEQAKRIAMQKAALINDAFQTLKSPLRRIEYLLSLKGRDIRHEQTSLQDPMFLMQQMEWREALEALREQQDLDAVDDFAAQIGSELNQRQSRLAEQLDLPDSGWNVEQLADDARKLTFIYKLKDEIEQLEAQLDDL